MKRCNGRFFYDAALALGDSMIGFETDQSADDDFAHTVGAKRSETIRITIEGGKTRSVVIPP